MGEIATRFGIPKETVSRGLALSTAAVFSGLASKADDPDAMHQIVDFASHSSADSPASAVTAGHLSDPASSMMSTGRKFLSSLFGGNSSQVTELVGRESGLGAGPTTAMLVLAAHSLANYFGRRFRDGSLTAASLPSFLRNEAPGIRKLLPASFDDVFKTSVTKEVSRTIDVNPVIAQSVSEERSSSSWLPWAALAALIAGALWYGWGRGVRMNIEAPSLPAIGTTGTLPDAGPTIPKEAVGDLSIPKLGVTDKLLAFIGSDRAPDTTTWFDFDQLRFDTGSATLRPESQQQLKSVADILKAHPNVHVKIAGYTDNIGSTTANLKLSEQRAANVKDELAKMGIAGDRLTTEGYGETHPVGDNATEAGRAMNRRISMLVTQK
jgi:outer membrane protein OmpA-like peptidoglycan-associated protein